MSSELLVGAVIAAVIILGVVAKLLPKRQPPLSVFKCSRCGTASRHSNRTAEAWRNGKIKFFCQGCHSKWLQSRPPQERESHASRGASSGNSGCLGVVVLFALLPLGGWLVWAYA